MSVVRRPTPAADSTHALLPAPGRGDLIACVVLVASVFAFFAPALSAEFVRWDDPLFVTENPRVHGLTGENVKWMFTEVRGGHYHPLTWMSWALDYELSGGLRPRMFHLTNVILHAVNAVLVFFLLKRVVWLAIGGRAGAGGASLTMACALGAMLFAVHPLRAESVAWVTERRDVLSAAFLFGAAIMYLRSVRQGEAGLVSRWAYAASVVLLVLSCLSKAWGMSFFAIALVLDWYPLRRLSTSTWMTRGTVWVLAQKIPFIVIGVLTARMAAIAQQEGGAAKTLAEWGAAERIVQACYGLWFYVRATVLPRDLSPLYQLPVRLDPWEAKYIVAYAFVVIAVGAVVVLRKRVPGLAAAGAVALIVLLPVLGFMQSGEQFVADRYSYLPAVALSALIAAAVRKALTPKTNAADASANRPVRTLAFAGAGIVVVTLGVLTHAQTAIWTNTETLWRHAVTVSPSSHVLVSYGMELQRLGHPREAGDLYRTATKLNPADGRAWFSYAGQMRDSGNLQEAERAYKEAAKLIPQAYQALQNLGVMYAKHGHREAAMEAFRLAVADVEKGGNRPLSGGPYMTLAFALEDAGRIDEAAASLRKALAFADTKGEAQRELDRLAKGAAPAAPGKP